MATQPEDRITVTKLDAARRQIETALDLWFHEGDPVAIHTLASAAHRVVHDLAEMGGDGSVLLNTNLLTGWGLDAKAFKKAIRAAETFFKHAQNDPHETFSFSLSQTERIFVSAIECYRRLVHEKSRLMTLFLYWFHIQYPQFLDFMSELAGKRLAKLVPLAKELTRPKFYEVFFQRNLKG